MDPIASIDFQKDSSLAMLLTAQKRGWELFYLEQQDLYQKEGVACGSMMPLQVHHDSDNWFTLGERQELPLDSLNVILMRKRSRDPFIWTLFTVPTCWSRPK